MSGFNTYISSMFCELNVDMINAYYQFPAVYDDGILNQLATIVARHSSPDENEHRINVRLSSVRQSIEHIFVLQKYV